MENTIISLIIGIVLGIGLSALYLAYRIKLVMNSLDSYIEEAINEVNNVFAIVEVEKENNVYYCYIKDSKEFICQAPDIKTLIDAFKLKHPNKAIIISDSTDQAIVAEVKEYIK